MKRTTSVDEYIKNAAQFKSELASLRKILRSTALEECIKWGAPCYVSNNKNIVGMASFKNYFGLWFHQGALLEDTHGKLINAQEGKTKALRQWRMTTASDIKPRIIKQYLNQAISNAQTGKEIKPTRKRKLALPGELSSALESNKKLKLAFNKLKPGEQRQYANYISEAKRADTKVRRLKKIRPMIMKGAGLHDKYRNC